MRFHHKNYTGKTSDDINLMSHRYIVNTQIQNTTTSRNVVTLKVPGKPKYYQP